MGWVSDEVLLELVRLSREVLIHEKDLDLAVDRLTTRTDAHFKLQNERLASIEKSIASIAESQDNSEAITRAQDDIYAMEDRLEPIVTDQQAVEDKLKNAGKDK